EHGQMLTDYTTTNISIDRHPIGLLRDALARDGTRSTAELHQLRDGTRVAVAGLVIARQRPPAANGITFLLLEDETGTLNVILPGKLYEPNKLTIRTAPLVLV